MARDKRMPQGFSRESGVDTNAAFEINTPKTVLASAAVILAVVAVILSRHWMSPSPPAWPLVPVEADDQSPSKADEARSGVESAPTIELPSISGAESPAHPPIVFSSGGPSDAPDLTRPAAAVFSVLDRMDRGSTDQLPQCFVAGNAPQTDDLYPRYLGHPIELVKVVMGGEAATVTWNATVHTAFSREGENHISGDRLALTTRLMRTDGRWLLRRLHE